MQIEALILRNFRNYENVSLTFSPGVNCIVGGNGEGKTNLLEALYFLSTGRSFRTTHLNDLIRHGASFFYLEAHFQKDGISQTIKTTFDGQTRKLQYNETLYSYFTSLLGILPSVLYAPEDLALICGTPSDRRRFLDLHIAQVDPLYVHHLGRYHKAMKQRNTLLRQKKVETLPAWEQAMAQAAAYLLPKRLETLQNLQAPLKQWMRDLSLEKEQVSIHYHHSWPTERDLLFHLQKNRSRDLLLGSTQIGPHRDDLILAIDEKCAKSFSSEGQKRCCAAALRFAQWETMKEAIRDLPLMCIDDFGIQLDKERHQAFQHHLHKLGQVFLTAPLDSEDLLPGSSKQIIQISQGAAV
jgi:DNA replication and repair protein RecF